MYTYIMLTYVSESAIVYKLTIIILYEQTVRTRWFGEYNSNRKNKINNNNNLFSFIIQSKYNSNNNNINPITVTADR